MVIEVGRLCFGQCLNITWTDAAAAIDVVAAPIGNGAQPAGGDAEFRRTARIGGIPILASLVNKNFRDC